MFVLKSGKTYQCIQLGTGYVYFYDFNPCELLPKHNKGYLFPLIKNEIILIINEEPKEEICNVYKVLLNDQIGYIRIDYDELYGIPLIEIKDNV